MIIGWVLFLLGLILAVWGLVSNIRFGFLMVYLGGFLMGKGVTMSGLF